MTIGLERKGALTKIFQATLEINKKNNWMCNNNPIYLLLVPNYIALDTKGGSLQTK